MHNEPKPGLALFDRQGGTGSYMNAIVFHSGLTFPDSDGNSQPLVAQKIPSLSDGSWKSFPDGKMEVTWKLRPNVKWHDGQPLKAEDLMLGMRMVQDKELGLAQASWLQSISAFAAPDPQTFVLSWSEPYFLANQVLPKEIPAVATHIVGQLYEDAVKSGDRQPFLNSPYWAAEWIGLGPYKVAGRVEGDRLDAVAFDDYFLGRPKIDRLVIRYYADIDAEILAVMSGDLDFVPVGSFSSNHVYTLKQQWEPTGAGIMGAYPNALGSDFFQFGDPESPWAKDVKVRRSIVHMYDRQSYVDNLEFGTTTVADTVVNPRDSLYKLLEDRQLPKYPYDLNQAARLLGEAGWTKGTDGSYRNANGGSFDIEVITKQVSDNSLRRAQVSADMLKQAGLNGTFRTFPNNVPTTEDRKQRSTFRGLFASVTVVDEPRAGQQFLTSGIRVDADGSSVGSNTYRYSNSAYDQLFDKYVKTLDPAARQGLRADVLRYIADQVMVVPIFYSFNIVSQAIAKKVHGPGWIHPTQVASGWDIQTWDVD